MANIIHIDPRPRVLHPGFVRQLAEANCAVRQLRHLGCRVIRQAVTDAGSEIVIDRNPHRTLAGCSDVHVVCAIPQRAKE